jgi:hypothetical protein
MSIKAIHKEHSANANQTVTDLFESLKINALTPNTDELSAGIDYANLGRENFQSPEEKLHNITNRAFFRDSCRWIPSISQGQRLDIGIQASPEETGKLLYIAIASRNVDLVHDIGKHISSRPQYYDLVTDALKWATITDNEEDCLNQLCLTTRPTLPQIKEAEKVDSVFNPHKNNPNNAKAALLKAEINNNARGVQIKLDQNFNHMGQKLAEDTNNDSMAKLCAPLSSEHYERLYHPDSQRRLNAKNYSTIKGTYRTEKHSSLLGCSPG